MSATTDHTKADMVRHLARYTSFSRAFLETRTAEDLQAKLDRLTFLGRCDDPTEGTDLEYVGEARGWDWAVAPDGDVWRSRAGANDWRWEMTAAAWAHHRTALFGEVS